MEIQRARTHITAARALALLADHQCLGDQHTATERLTKAIRELEKARILLGGLSYTVAETEYMMSGYVGFGHDPDKLPF